ncbi:MAG TPA: VOC family protein, partial [Thermoanaerobaculia bacterium]
MAERNAFDRLNELVEEILAGRPGAPVVEADLAVLAAVAADLRNLPSAAFKSSLMRKLIPEEAMSTMTTPTVSEVRPGFHAITPYFVVRSADEFIAFLQQAFGGELRGRHELPDGRVPHAEVKIGDSMLELGEASAEFGPLTLATHLYVNDADAVYASAVRAGATTLLPPTDQWYGDREAAIADPFGNYWYIATHQATGSAPEGLRTITPFVHVRGTDRLIDFIKRAFGATELDRTAGPDGLIMHAALRVGDSVIEMGEAHGEWKPMPAAVHLFVPDADAVFRSATEAGATVLYAV